MKRRLLDMGQLMLLFREDELAGVGDAVPLSMLDGRNMVGLTTSGPVGDAFTTELKRQGVVIHEVVSNQTFYIAAALTGCGAGMTVVDEFTARAGSEASVRFLPLHPPIRFKVECVFLEDRPPSRSEEHTSDLQPQMRNSYALFSVKK